MNDEIEGRRSSATYDRFVGALQAIFDRQYAEVISRLSHYTVASRHQFALNHWLDPMVELLSPHVMRHFQSGVSAFNVEHHDEIVRAPARKASGTVIEKAIGVNFRLLNPKVLTAVNDLTLKFCQVTNETAVGELNDALAELRRQLAEGIRLGETTTKITDRVRQIFTDPKRAARIAITETMRARAGGEFLSAKESGFIDRKRWLVSADACDECLELQGKIVPLDEPFVVIPGGGPYSVVMYNPLHPRCQCSVQYLARPKSKKPPPIPVAIPVPEPEPELTRGPVFGKTLSIGPIKSLTTQAPMIVGSEFDGWDGRNIRASVRPVIGELDRDGYAKKIRAAILRSITAKKVSSLTERTYRMKSAIFKMAESINEFASANGGPVAVQADPKLLSALNYRKLVMARKTREYHNLVEVQQRAISRWLPRLVDMIPDGKRIRVHAKNLGYIPDSVLSDIKYVAAKMASLMRGSWHGEDGIDLHFSYSPNLNRSAYTGPRGGIRITRGTTISSLFHEVGHALEDLYHDLAWRARAFWYSRCGGSENAAKNVNLADFAGHSYRRDEVGNPDDFDKFIQDPATAAYAGKTYPGGGMEILAVGLEALVANPYRFAKEDPQYFALIIGMLQGRYR